MTRRSGRGVAASLRGCRAHERTPVTRAAFLASGLRLRTQSASETSGSSAIHRTGGSCGLGVKNISELLRWRRWYHLAVIRRAGAGLSLRSARVSVVGEPWRHLNHADRGGPPPALDGFHRAGASDTSPSLLALCL